MGLEKDEGGRERSSFARVLGEEERLSTCNCLNAHDSDDKLGLRRVRCARGGMLLGDPVVAETEARELRTPSKGYVLLKSVNDGKCRAAVEEGSPTVRGSCKTNNDKHLWFFDDESRLRPKSHPNLALGMGGLLKEKSDGNKKQQWKYVKGEKWIKKKHSKQCLAQHADAPVPCKKGESLYELVEVKGAGDAGDKDDDDDSLKHKIYLYYGYGVEDSWEYGGDSCVGCYEWYKIYTDCYEAEALKKGSRIISGQRNCDDFSKYQRWIFEKKRWRLAANPKLCVEAPASMKVGDQPRLAKCASSGLSKKLQKCLYSESRLAGIDEGNPNAYRRRVADDRVGISPMLDPDLCLKRHKKYVELIKCEDEPMWEGDGMGFRRVDIYD